MNVNLTPKLEKFIQEKVSSGRYNSASEVVRESLRLLEEYDRIKTSRYEKLRREVEVGLLQAEAGRVRPFDPRRVMKRVRKQAAKARKKKQRDAGRHHRSGH
jgi:antitoxin ParD1/3/4